MDSDIPLSAKSSARIAIVSSVFVIVLMIIGIVWYFLSPQDSFPVASVSPTSVPTTAPSPILTPDISQAPSPGVSVTVTLAEGEKIYSSARLGVSFKYLEIPDPFAPNNVDKILVQETGNRIYIYPQSLSPEGGQFVEVFQKGAAESLEDAIKRLFLSGKDPKRCIVTTTKTQPYADTFIHAEITFPADPNETPETSFENTTYCSENYAQTNGVRYFLADNNHPTQFFFFSIGQYAINAGNNIPWQQTVRIAN